MHATLCDMIMDLVQNAIEADAAAINLNVEETETQLNIVISDNGKGMSAETLEKAKDPFWSDGTKHKQRNVGLGLPFLFQTAEMTCGMASVESEEGVGTTVKLSVDPKHVDLPEFGNFATAAVSLMSYGFDGDLTIKRSRNGAGYTISKRELTDALGNLSDVESIGLAKDFLESNEDAIIG